MVLLEKEVDMEVIIMVEMAINLEQVAEQKDNGIQIQNLGNFRMVVNGEVEQVLLVHFIQVVRLQVSMLVEKEDIIIITALGN